MTRPIAEYVARLRGERAHANAFEPDLSVHAPFMQQLRASGLPRRAAGLVAAHAAATLLLLASWVLIGSGLLEGRLDRGWLIGWAVTLATAVPLWTLARRFEGVIAIGLGALIKRRVLAGALAGDVDGARGRGMGRTLSEMLEAQAIEQIGPAGGLQVVLATLELAAAACALAFGATAAWGVAVLVAFWLLAVALMREHLGRRELWTDRRLALTRGLVERMNAHRTRLVQQSPEEWHRDEDRELTDYIAASRNIDASSAWLEAALPRSYVILSLAVLVPSYLADRATLVELAVTLGTILFSALAFERFTLGFARAAPAWVAWRRLEPLFRAGRYDVRALPTVEPVSGVGPIMVSGMRIAAARTSCCSRRRSRSSRASAFCSRAQRAAGNRHWPRCSPAFVRPPRDTCSQEASIARRWVRISGAAAWSRLRSTTRTTFSRQRLRSICCLVGRCRIRRTTCAKRARFATR
jgi:hypothetical protein